MSVDVGEDGRHVGRQPAVEHLDLGLGAGAGGVVAVVAGVGDDEGQVPGASPRQVGGEARLVGNVTVGAVGGVVDDLAEVHERVVAGGVPGLVGVGGAGGAGTGRGHGLEVAPPRLARPVQLGADGRARPHARRIGGAVEVVERLRDLAADHGDVVPEAHVRGGVVGVVAHVGVGQRVQVRGLARPGAEDVAEVGVLLDDHEGVRDGGHRGRGRWDGSGNGTPDGPGAGHDHPAGQKGHRQPAPQPLPHHHFKPSATSPSSDVRPRMSDSSRWGDGGRYRGYRRRRHPAPRPGGSHFGPWPPALARALG